jgi:PQQ-like domain
MRARRLTLVSILAAACGLVAACGSATPAVVSAPRASASAIPSAAVSSAGELLDWPEFGLNPQRSDVSELATGVTAANVTHLRHITVGLTGTIDSSPIYLHDVSVDGAIHDVIVATSIYGRTFAIDANSGQILWTFTPPGYSGWAGTPQITVASPLADPDRLWVYATSPNGIINKLSLANGSEDREGSWPARVTLEPVHEKLAAALNIDGPDIVAATSGYIGDIPVYQGHVVLVSRATGRLLAVFNTLCANRRDLQIPDTCPASDSAVLSRAGPVVEPGGARILLDTGNGPWNGTTDFGDSVLELSFPSLDLRQSWTSPEQEDDNDNDVDQGSSAPALLGENRIVLAGKDGIMRVLALSRLDGHSPSSAAARAHPLGGELQTLPLPGGGELFTAPAVWRHDGHTTMFVADENATAAYVMRGGRLYEVWQNDNPGTSPVMAGGLLYVYDPNSGGIYVYRPSSPRPIVKLPGEPGHWNSPIVVDGHIVEPSGDVNEHQLTGTLEIFSTP